LLSLKLCLFEIKYPANREPGEFQVIDNRNVPQSEFYNPFVFIGFLQQTKPKGIQYLPGAADDLVYIVLQ